MKAIPDLDFAARHINKPAVPPKPQITVPITSTTAAAPATGAAATVAASAAMPTAGGEQQPGKVQLAAQKLNSLEGAGSHRGSGGSTLTCGKNGVDAAGLEVLTRCPPSAVDLNVTRYRTEKPSKSPPPPPPRRSFPSAHGLTTNRTGDVVVTTKNQKVRRSLGPVLFVGELGVGVGL